MGKYDGHKFRVPDSVDELLRAGWALAHTDAYKHVRWPGNHFTADMIERYGGKTLQAVSERPHGQWYTAKNTLAYRWPVEALLEIEAVALGCVVSPGLLGPCPPQLCTCSAKLHSRAKTDPDFFSTARHDCWCKMYKPQF